MSRYRDSCSPSSCLQRQDLRSPNPRNDIDSSTEDEHVEEEECYRDGGERRTIEAEQNADHKHAEAQAATADHHGLAAAHAVEEQGWDGVANRKHELDEASDQSGAADGHADVGGEDDGHV